MIINSYLNYHGTLTHASFFFLCWSKWAVINSIMYKPLCAVVLGVEDDYPVFGKIMEIFIKEDNTVIFNVKVMRTVHFLKHHHAYAIEQTDTLKLVTFDCFCDPFPLHIRKFSSLGQIIIVKHHIVGTLQL